MMARMTLPAPDTPQGAVRPIGPRGLALIRRFESFQPEVYLCPASKLTIGYGHRLQPGEFYGRPITLTEAEQLLRDDLAATCALLARRWPGLTERQFDACASLAYNIGLSAFANSTLARRLSAGDMAGAAEQFNRWVYASGKILPGLVTRRAAERALFAGEGP